MHAAYTAAGQEPGGGELCVLVLWRGEPGWYSHRDRVLKALHNRGFRWDRIQVHGKESEPVLNEGIRTHSRDLGDIYLAFDYEWGKHRLQIQGDVLELGANNVVPVDHVDGTGGEPQISLLRIESAIPASEAEFWELISRSSSIRSILEAPDAER